MVRILRPTLRVVVACVFAVIGNSTTQQSAHAQAVVLVATAPDDITLDDLGRVYRADFTAVPGASRAFGPDMVRATSNSRFVGSFSATLRMEELAANAQAWGGVVQGGVSAASTDSYRVYRAWEQASAASMSRDVDLAAQPIPPEARYVLTKIISGYSYEMILRGTESQLRISAGSSIAPGASISGSYGTTATGASFWVNLLGFQPRGDSPILTENPSSVEQSFQRQGDPRPILVEYTEIPGRAPELIDVYVRSITYDCSQSYDGDGSGPEIRVKFSYVADGRTSETVADGRQDECTVSYADGLGLRIARRIRFSPDRALSISFQERDLIEDDILAGYSYYGNTIGPQVRVEVAGGRYVVVLNVIPAQ